MTSVQLAFQQLDPLAALVERPLTVIAASSIPLYALVMTVMSWQEVDYPIAAVAALLATVVSCLILVFGSSPLRAPFTAGRHAVATGLAVAAHLLSAFSMWESNSQLRDDWGPVAIGLVMLTLSRYRPPNEIAATGVTLALFGGVFALVQAATFDGSMPPILFALIALTPIITLSLASSTFARMLIDSTEGWQARAQSAATALRGENSEWIARSVQQDRVTILNQDVVPFFAAVLQKSSINEADRARAREISDEIRAIMIADFNRTWLEAIVDLATGPRPVWEPALRDPHRLAMRMTTRQRTALRAGIVALSEYPGFDPADFLVSLTAAGSQVQVAMAATVAPGDNVARGEFAPYLAVMRIVFDDLKVEFSSPTLTLRFSYDQR